MNMKNHQGEYVLYGTTDYGKLVIFGTMKTWNEVHPWISEVRTAFEGLKRAEVDIETWHKNNYRIKDGSKQYYDTPEEYRIAIQAAEDKLKQLGIRRFDFPSPTHITWAVIGEDNEEQHIDC